MFIITCSLHIKSVLVGNPNCRLILPDTCTHHPHSTNFIFVVVVATIWLNERADSSFNLAIMFPNMLYKSFISNMFSTLSLSLSPPLSGIRNEKENGELSQSHKLECTYNCKEIACAMGHLELLSVLLRRDPSMLRAKSDNIDYVLTTNRHEQNKNVKWFPSLLCDPLRHGNTEIVELTLSVTSNLSTLLLTHTHTPHYRPHYTPHYTPHTITHHTFNTSTHMPHTQREERTYLSSSQVIIAREGSIKTDIEQHSLQLFGRWKEMHYTLH